MSWVLLVQVRRKEKKRFKLPEIKVWNLYVWKFGMDTCLGLCMESMDFLVRKPS